MALATASSVSPLMRELSEYIAGALRKPLPADVAETARHHLVDTLAAMVSGSRLVPGRKAAAYIETLGGTREATVIGTRLVTSCVNAALANGMMAHADETDDSHVPSLTHPGCAVVASSLAMAEREGRSGRDLLRAMVLGYDLCARSTLALKPQKLRARSHSSHSFGPVFGAAAAAGALARLDASKVRYLLSYTVQQASGVDCWARDKEHVEKAFDFGGMAARNGVAAATMVASGFTGVEDVFSGEKNFFTAFADAPDPNAFTRGLGVAYEVMNTNIKRWCVGTPIQAALDSLLAIMDEHALKPDELESLSVTIHQSGSVTVNDRSIPDINLQYLLSVMLLDGTVTFKSAHDHRRMNDPRVLALKKRIALHGDPALEDEPRRQAIMLVRTRDGRELKHHTKVVRGTAANRMTRQEVDDKAFDLLVPVLGKPRARKLIDIAWRIEKLPAARDLRPLLRA